MHENAAALIPELQAWNDEKGISLEGWINCIGRYDHIIGYATIFWPDFVLYEDCIFFETPDRKYYESWLAKYKGDKTRVEGMINHQHVVDLSPNAEFKPTKEIVIHIGRLLKDIWQCKLNRDFPDRRVKVEFCEDVETENLVDYQITVFQERE